MAAAIAPLAVDHASSDAPIPTIFAMPMQPSNKIAWLWGTAAGRHMIGRQALSPKMRACLQKSTSPVAFATGDGNQPGQDSIAFEGSKIFIGEEVYVLTECLPAQSIGKTG